MIQNPKRFFPKESFTFEQFITHEFVRFIKQNQPIRVIWSELFSTKWFRFINSSTNDSFSTFEEFDLFKESSEISAHRNNSFTDSVNDSLIIPLTLIFF